MFVPLLFAGLAPLLLRTGVPPLSPLRPNFPSKTEILEEFVPTASYIAARNEQTYRKCFAMRSEKIIGIVGGLGPYAGLEFVRKIFDQTIATTDQEHLPVVLLSHPDRVGDRTSYILGKTEHNPAYAIADILEELQSLGASVAGIACNSAHAPAIFDVIADEMERRKISLRVIHMIEETAQFLAQHHPASKRIGLIATLGTVKSRVYETQFEPTGPQLILPTDEIQLKMVHGAIYDPLYGIKARSNPVTEQARQALLNTIAHLQSRGAEAIILGCTEVTLAVTERKIGGIALLDPGVILARALIRDVSPEKLRPLEES
jgi:aspartate racemase